MGHFSKTIKVTGQVVHNASIIDLAKLSEYASDFRIETKRGETVAHWIEFEFEFPYSVMEEVSKLLEKLKG